MSRTIPPISFTRIAVAVIVGTALILLIAS